MKLGWKLQIITVDNINNNSARAHAPVCPASPCCSSRLLVSMVASSSVMSTWRTDSCCTMASCICDIFRRSTVLELLTVQCYQSRIPVQ